MSGAGLSPLFVVAIATVCVAVLVAIAYYILQVIWRGSILCGYRCWDSLNSLPPGAGWTDRQNEAEPLNEQVKMVTMAKRLILWTILQFNKVDLTISSTGVHRVFPNWDTKWLDSNMLSTENAHVGRDDGAKHQQQEAAIRH